MDVSDITKVANRKRMSEDAEKLRDKISRETAKIIKLKVAQDTAYWDLKEKLQQVESNHERLQQNMIEVQMQHETISGQYEDELRLRPEILNKLGGTRALCEVLEEYARRMRASVARAAADRAALALAGRAAAARARLLAQHARHHAALHDQLRARAERHAAAAGEARARLDAECARRQRARADADSLAAQLHRRAADLDRKDRVIAEMQRESQRLIAEFEARCTALEGTIADQQREWERRVAAAAEARRDAEAEAARGERARADLQGQLQQLQHKLSEAEACIDRLNRSTTTLSEANEQLTGELGEKSQALQRSAAHADQLQAQAAAAQAQCAALQQAARDADEQRARAQRERDDVAAAHQHLQLQLQQHRSESACAAAALEARAADKEAQLQAASSTIARLMRDVQAEADARHRLEAAARAKDDELARQATLLRDMDAERERLRATIHGMQATIDNIQKELTGRAPAACAERRAPAACAERRERPERLRAEPAPPLDRMLYNFLSDASADADGHDSPLSLSQVKLDLNAKSRAFFKNKRCDSKHKRAK